MVTRESKSRSLVLLTTRRKINMKTNLVISHVAYVITRELANIRSFMEPENQICTTVAYMKPYSYCEDIYLVFARIQSPFCTKSLPIIPSFNTAKPAYQI